MLPTKRASCHLGLSRHFHLPTALRVLNLVRGIPPDVEVIRDRLPDARLVGDFNTGGWEKTSLRVSPGGQRVVLSGALGYFLLLYNFSYVSRFAFSGFDWL